MPTRCILRTVYAVRRRRSFPSWRACRHLPHCVARTIWKFEFAEYAFGTWLTGWRFKLEKNGYEKVPSLSFYCCPGCSAYVYYIWNEMFGIFHWSRRITLSSARCLRCSKLAWISASNAVLSAAVSDFLCTQNILNVQCNELDRVEVDFIHPTLKKRVEICWKWDFMHCAVMSAFSGA